MELRRFASLGLKWLWLLVLGTLVAGGIAYQASRSQPPVYRASLKLLVNQTQSANGPDYSSLMASEYLTRTYAQMITSRRVLDAAYQRLGLGPEEQTSSASAQVVSDTQLIALSVEDESPSRARDVATAIAAAFVEQRVADQAAQSTAPRQALRQQIVDLESQMAETARAIEAARAGGDARTGELQRLEGALAQYQISHAELSRAEGDMQLASARLANAIQVVEPAVAPVTPIRPKVIQDTLLAAILGLLVSLGLALLLERVPASRLAAPLDRDRTAQARAGRDRGRYSSAPWRGRRGVRRQGSGWRDPVSGALFHHGRSHRRTDDTFAEASSAAEGGPLSARRTDAQIAQPR